MGAGVAEDATWCVCVGSVWAVCVCGDSVCVASVCVCRQCVCVDSVCGTSLFLLV